MNLMLTHGSERAGAIMLDGDRPTVEVVVPVHNEERDLERCVRKLHAYLSSSFPFAFRIIIADNASTDATWSLALCLSAELDHLRAVRLDAKGRGRALRAVWSSSDADILAYMDVDLSTGLEALLPLVAPLISGHSDVAIGTRLSRGVSTCWPPRSPTCGASPGSAATCCGSPWSASPARSLTWCCTWRCARRSARRRPTWWRCWRRRSPTPRPTAAGPSRSAAPPARSATSSRVWRCSRSRSLTAGALGGLHAVAPRASRSLELAVLVMANLVATFLRFLLLRDWVFHPSRPTSLTTTPIAPPRSAR